MNEPINATSFANVIKKPNLCGVEYIKSKNEARKLENSRKQMARYYANKRIQRTTIHHRITFNNFNLNY